MDILPSVSPARRARLLVPALLTLLIAAFILPTFEVAATGGGVEVKSVVVTTGAIVVKILDKTTDTVFAVKINAENFVIHLIDHSLPDLIETIAAAIESTVGKTILDRIILIKENVEDFLLALLAQVKSTFVKLCVSAEVKFDPTVCGKILVGQTS